MFKIKIFLLSHIIELHGSSKPLIGAMMHTVFLMEMVSSVPFLVELYTVESPTFHTLIGEYNSVREFTRAFEDKEVQNAL